MTKIYAIIDKETGLFDHFNGRVAWASPGAAKLSFRADSRSYNCETRKYEVKKFDDQSRYEIVELTEPYFRLKGLEE